jgi:DNA repair exonuclease SbcCD nuclease subunit
MFRFLHAADIHLDSPLLGLDRYEGAPVEAIRGATRRAFSNLVKLALRERVDFVLLAGDIYDGDWLDYNTGLFFVNELRELEKAGIPAVLIRGNHDAESRITSRLTLPPNVRELPSSKPGTVRFDRIGVAVHGQGYAHQAETRNLAASYPPADRGSFNIGVLHTALNGREGHEPYAPCTIEQLAGHGYEYWALGHVHKREAVHVTDHVRIDYPGNLQGRNIREAGPKGCLLVTVDSSRRMASEFRAVDVFRWAEVDVDAQEARSLEAASDLAARAIEEERLNADERPLAVRVRITCSPAVYRRLCEDQDRLRYELAAQLGGQAWIEKVKPRQAEIAQSEAVPLTGDAASELRAALKDLSSDPDALKAIFTEGDCDKLRKKLPPEVRKILEEGSHDGVLDLSAAFLAAGLEEEAS